MRTVLCILLASAVMLAIPATAQTTASIGQSETSGARMVLGGRESQPIGHYEFCGKRPAECRTVTSNTTPVTLTKKIWRAVTQVNDTVNREVRQRNDRDIYGKEEVWTYPVRGVGDCEDFVLEKRRRLASKGIPLSNLLITVVKRQDGEGHAVLTLRTDQGDFILDNLNSQVRGWRTVPYKFVKAQDPRHTGRWVAISGSSTVASR